VGLSTFYSEYGHLYFGAAKSHLDHLDALQHQAAGNCHRTIPSIKSHRHAAVIGLTYRLLDEGHGNFKFFIPEFVTTATRISSHLLGYRLTLPGHLDLIIL